MCVSLPVSVSAMQAIFEEFNTLSVVYQQPAALFVQSAQYQVHEDEQPAEQVRSDSACCSTMLLLPKQQTTCQACKQGRVYSLTLWVLPHSVLLW